MEDIIKIEAMKKEMAEVIRWEEYTSVAFISFLLICAIFNTTGKTLFIHFIWKYAPKGRPINIMFMKDQMIQLLSISICTVLVLASLTSGTPIEVLFGPEACWILWSSSMIHNMNHSFGSLGMAAFRLICIKFQYLAFDNIRSQKIIKKIFALDFLVNIGLFLVCLHGTMLANTNLSLEFCRGHSRTFSEVLSLHNGIGKDDFHLGLRYISFAIFIGQIAIITEFVLYVYLFYTLYQESKDNTALTKEMKKRKFKRNAITLTGQGMAFIIHIVGAIIIQVFLVLHDSDSGIFQCLSIIWSTAITVTHFVSSAELKRHYFNFDI